MADHDDSFPALYHQLVQTLGLPPSCELDADGRSTLVDGHDVEITVQYVERLSETVVFSVIDDLADNEHRLEILERMFRANFFWQATKGFTLALEDNGWRVVLMGREHNGYFTNIAQLYAYLVHCGKLAWEWRQLIQETALPALPDFPDNQNTAKEATAPLESFPGSGEEGNSADASLLHIRP